MKKRIDPKLPIPALGSGDTPDPPVKPDGYQDRLNRRLFELFREFDDGTVAVYDEGTYLGQADGLNFIGTDVTAASSTTLPSGIFDITVTGSGGTATVDTLSVTASEDVAAGDLINIYSSSGSFRARKAKASAAGYEAFGWTDSAVTSGNAVTVRFLGKNSHASGLTPGPVFLSDTAGLATSTCPSGSGHVAQQVGVTENATTYAFEWQPAVLLAAAHAVTTGGSSQSTYITTTQNITINSAVGAGWLTMVGGGGGGKSSAASAAPAGGGGGAGEYCQNYMIRLTPRETVTVTIGNGGAGGTAGGSGADGGTTSFACAAGTYFVLGGKGATTGAGASGGGPKGAGGGVAGNPGGAGALGSAESPVHFGGSSGGGGGDVVNGVGGAGGGAPGYLTGGAAGTASANGGAGGGGAASIWGNGGAGGNANGAGSSAAANTGAGGGGAGGNNGTAQDGGAGGSGFVLLMYVA